MSFGGRRSLRGHGAAFTEFALFLAKDWFRTHALPHPVDSQTILSHRFHLKPLLPAITDGQDFFVLALSKNAVEFSQASRHGIEKLTLGKIPKSADEALRHVEPEKSLQHHTTQPVAQGGPSGMVNPRPRTSVRRARLGNEPYLPIVRIGTNPDSRGSIS